jgi:transposase
MSLFLLSEPQMARIAPHFPLAHGVPRVDDRRVVSGIVCVIRHGLQWKDAPQEYGPHKTRLTIASSAGAGWACSTASSRRFPAKGRHRSGS